MTTLTAQDARVVQTELEVRISAPIERVWTALVDHIDAWWLPDFRMVERSQRIVFEPRVGGMLYEQGANDAALIWGQVLAITPHRSLHMVAHIAPPFGAATSMLYFQLDVDDVVTVVTLTNAMIGRVDDATAEQTREGWQALLQAMQAFAEQMQ